MTEENWMDEFETECSDCGEVIIFAEGIKHCEDRGCSGRCKLIPKYPVKPYYPLAPYLPEMGI